MITYGRTRGLGTLGINDSPPLIIIDLIFLAESQIGGIVGIGTKGSCTVV